MNITCNKSKLLNSIGISLKAVPNKSTMRILGFIAIIAEDDVIKLISNNLELGIETALTGDIMEPGKICVDAKMFSEIVRKLPNDDINMYVGSDEDSYMSTDEGEKIRKMSITSGKAKFEIPVLPTDEFVFLPNINGSDTVVISQFDLKSIINQTEFSISDNENTKIMTGELFEIDDNSLRMVALDGNRIAIRKITLDNSYPHKKVIIPGKTLREISKILSDDNEKMVDINFSENHVTFKFDDTIVLSRLIDGNYYDVDKMLTDDYRIKITINKQEIYETIDRSMLLRKDSDKKPIIFDIKDNVINFNMKTNIGSMNEDIEVKKEGDDLKIGFNPKFMIDAMKNIGDEEVDMYFINAKSPCFIRDTDKSYIYLILPINF